MAVRTLSSNGRKWSLWGTGRPPGERKAYPYNEGSVRADYCFSHTRGNNMDKQKPNLKIKAGLTLDTTTKARTPDARMEAEIFRRSTSTPRSPPTKRVARTESIDHDASLEAQGSELNSSSREETVVLEDIKKERIVLEEFLFNENNKISKSAIKFILSKWSFLESKLYEDRLEKEKLKEKLKVTYQYRNQTKTYAKVTSGLGDSLDSSDSSVRPETEKRKISRKEKEVILIKPIEECDKRNNDQIKEDLIRKMDNIRRELRVKGMRQMRNKGIVMEVKGKEDVDLIKNVDLKGIGLKFDEPNKINPSVVIYDVETGHEASELKEDFINKNFNVKDGQLEELHKEVIFKHNYKTINNKSNWIVQVPGQFLENLVNRGRIYMLWRSYKIKEYLSIVRCYKCHGFGHMAKNCANPDQLCETCGSKDHLKDACESKSTPKCINCARNRRKESAHSVRSIECPEFKRQVEIYRNRIKWY